MNASPTRRSLLALSLAALSGCAPSASGAPGAPRDASPPPNVVLIVADDLGYGDLGSYGQTRIRTPRLDGMAAEGMRFTHFYSGSPVCAPARSTLMTGQHTGHTPIRGNTGSRRTADGGQIPLPAEAQTLAEVLQRAGYATGAFGKWGLGGPGSEGSAVRQGFDYFYGYLDQVHAHFYYPEFLIRNEERVPLPNRVRRDTVGLHFEGSGWAVVRGRHSHDAIADEALAFLDRNRERPFFLYVPFTIPHVELEAPQDSYGPYLDAAGRSIFPETPYPGDHYGPQAMPRATYAAMITRMDRDVGRILDRLKEYGLDRNTIVLFTSDNGATETAGADPDFFNSNAGFRGQKGTVYEGGIRVPMIAWGPGRVPAGRISEQVWAMWDLFPTLTELTGTRGPADLDGRSMAGVLTGRSRAVDRDPLYWEFPEGGGLQAVRHGRWKAVRTGVVRDPGAPVQLFDLAADPAESNDLAARHPEIAREMRAIMAREHTDSELFPALNVLE